MASDAAASCAAMLTAAAYGMRGFCFVAPTDCGLGLFARSNLRRGQAICTYNGPRLPLEAVTKGEYVLEVRVQFLPFPPSYFLLPSLHIYLAELFSVLAADTR